METSSVEPFKTAMGPLHGSVVSPCEDCVLRGWNAKVPVGSPVSFPKRSNPAWRLAAPPSPCRINAKSKHRINGERAGSAKPATELRRRITAQQGILGGSVVGCPLNGREKAWPMEGHYRVPSLFSKRSNPALRPGPPPKPLSN